MAEQRKELHPDPYFDMDGKPTRLVRYGDDASSDPVQPQNLFAVPAGALSRRKRPIIATVAALALCLAVVVGVLVSTHGSGSNADAAIIKAVTSAIGDKTAQIDMKNSLEIAGITDQAIGKGSVDFTNDSLEATLSELGSGQQQTIQAIYLGGTIYISLPQVSQVAPGKNWISLDLFSLENVPDSQGVLVANPLAVLHALALQGNRVSSLGSSTIDGKSVEGYGVTFNRSLMQPETDKASLPAWMKQALLQVTVNGASTKVYIDSAGHLVREMTTASEAINGDGTFATNDSIDFSDFGASASISAPTADQVLPISQFLNLAHNAITTS
jgi:hypothetical protein